MVRIRTIEQAYQEIKQNDPNTALSKYRFRQLVETGEIPSTKSWVKSLVDMEQVEKYLSNLLSVKGQ